MDSIDLMDCPSNMEIGVCWYKEGTNNKWTYDVMNHLMIDLETIIVLAFMTYIMNLDPYEQGINLKGCLYFIGKGNSKFSFSK